MENSVLGYGIFFTGSLFALLSLCIVALNYSVLYKNRHNRKQGIDKHVSMITLVPQLLLIVAYMIFRNFPVYPVSGWLLLFIALIDPGIWVIASLPIVMLFRK